MFAPQVAVGFRYEHPPVTVAKPAPHSGKINPGFNAACSEQVPQAVMRQPLASHQTAGPRQRALSFEYRADMVTKLGLPVCPEPFKELLQGGNQRKDSRQGRTGGQPPLNAMNRQLV